MIYILHEMSVTQFSFVYTVLYYFRSVTNVLWASINACLRPGSRGCFRSECCTGWQVNAR